MPITEVVEHQDKFFIVVWAPGGSNRPYSSPRNMAKDCKERIYWIRKMASTIILTEDQKKDLYDLANNVPFDDRVNGMCADAAIHDTDGHKPHAHIMLTVRALSENGTWQYKTQKEYLCIRDVEERGFTADEFKVAQRDGWEKHYQYRVGNGVFWGERILFTLRASE